MVTDIIRQRVAEVTGRPNSVEPLVERLQEVIGEQGRQVSATELQPLIEHLQRYVESAPELLDACAMAAAEVGVARHLAPILETAARYFLESEDLIPDNLGLFGLLDDAYLVHTLMAKISQQYQYHTGVPLLPFRLEGANQTVREILGEPLATTLDHAVADTIQAAAVRRQIEALAGYEQALPFSGYSEAGGPDRWGGSWQDQLARLGAALGLRVDR